VTRSLSQMHCGGKVCHIGTCVKNQLVLFH